MRFNSEENTEKSTYDRTYGGYWQTDKQGVMHEEGICVQGYPLIYANDTEVVFNAGTGELADFHILDGDIRRNLLISLGSSALHLFTKLSDDPRVANWGKSSGISLSFKPGLTIEETRRLTAVETIGIHHVGALNFKTKKLTKPILEVTQNLYIPCKWCMVDSIKINNLTNKEDKEATIAVGLNLRRLISADRAALNWYSDFHADKAGMHNISRLSDEELQHLLKRKQFQVEYREDEHCIVAMKDGYYLCLMINVPISGYVITAKGNAQEPELFVEDKSYPRQLLKPNVVIGFRSQEFTLQPNRSYTLKFTLCVGKTAKEAIATARKGLGIGVKEATEKAEDYWKKRLPSLKAGNTNLESMLRYAEYVVEANCEPDGRIAGGPGGWDRPTRAELTGYKNYYDQVDAAETFMDIPMYNPDYMRRLLLYDVNPETQRLTKCIVWRFDYENMLYYPICAYKLWMATEDRKFLNQYYPVLRNTLLWVHENLTCEDGLVRMLTASYDIFTVGLDEKKEITTKAQALAYESLRKMSKMAQTLGKLEDQKFFDTWADKIKEAANSKLWQKKYYAFTLNFLENLDVYGNCLAILTGLCNETKAKTIVQQIKLLYTGIGFPQIHPPLPSFVGAEPYGYQNGRMYVDLLGLIARVANKLKDKDLMEKVFDSFRRIVQMHKCFPVEIHPWAMNSAIKGNEIHAASALIGAFVYGIAGIQEDENLSFHPLLIPEMEGYIEIHDFLFRKTHFDIRIEGSGASLKRIEVDGKEVNLPFLPSQYYDGGKHIVVIQVR